MTSVVEPMGVGIVGAGDILGQYLDTLAGIPSVNVVGVAARDIGRVRAALAGRDLRACTVGDLMDDPRVSLVVDLTPPAAHDAVNRAAVAAGKHVYTEKPLALSFDDGAALLASADAAGVLVGGAPDTFLGTGLQTTLHALRSGAIGTPFAATAMWGGPGPEPWHPDPQFFYLRGGGPVLDMGPYYLTALVTHLGPVATVTARTTTTDRARVVGSGPLAGTPLRVEVPTYAAAILEHVSGALTTVTLSFETWASGNQLLEIYGTAGTLRLPDPNHFSLPGAVYRAGGPDEFVPLRDAAGFVAAGRGIGLTELLRASQAHRAPRASGALALHVAEVLFAVNDARPGDGPVAMTTCPKIPEPVPLGADVVTL